MWYRNAGRDHGVCFVFDLLYPEVGRGLTCAAVTTCLCSVNCRLSPCSHHGERKSWVVGWGGENLPVTLVWQFHAACGQQMCWQFDSWQVVGSLRSTTYTLRPLQVMLWLAECLIITHLNIPFVHTYLPRKLFYCCTYEAQTWMMKKEEQALLIFGRKMFRRICGPKYEDGEWKIRTNRELEELNKGENIVK